MTHAPLFRCRPAGAVLAVLAAASVQAMEIDTGNPDWSVRFDNTVKVGAMYRTKAANPALVDSFRLLVPGVPASAFPQALNFNEGDDNFRSRGLVSKRIDLLSEFDAVYQRRFGVRLSAAGWYDAAYDGGSHATDPANSQMPTDHFPTGTRDLAGRKADLLDAFVFGNFELGQGRVLTLRLGQHALQYGETLFFGDNGVATAQGPIDILKLQASPNAQFKELIRPVPQLSSQLQLSSDVSVGAYYQFAWKSDRLPPAGSYFSTSNLPWGSQQAEVIGIPNVGNFLLQPGQDRQPGHRGQFGGQLRWRLGDTDLGFYAARYSDKDGELYSHLNPQGAAGPGGMLPGDWSYVFPKAITLYGASASHTFDDFNVSAEGSIRNGMPLRSTNMIYGFFPGQPQPAYATGRTAHLNLETVASFGPNPLAEESTLVGEIAWNRVLSKNDPDGTLDAGRTRDATAMQFIYTPTYRQVLPGLDLNVPVGLRYTLAGNSSVTAWDARHTGSANVGVDGTYLGTWQFSLDYTHYLGKAVPFVDVSAAASGGPAIFGHGNPLADRDFIAATVHRTF